jgi:hypothetical protein
MAEEAVAQLYGLPLNEFVPGRDALARQLRKAGDRERAGEIAKLKRPAVAAWVVNQLARRNRKELDLLLDAGHRLRTGQLEALESGDPAQFEQARRDHDRAVRELVAHAKELLAGERGSSSDQMLASVERTLRYGSIDDEHRPALASGTLTTEVAAPGFGAFSGMTLPSEQPPRAPRAEQETASERRARAAALKAAQQAERDAERRVRDAEAAERKAAQELAEARNALDAAREAADRLRDVT